MSYFSGAKLWQLLTQLHVLQQRLRDQQQLQQQQQQQHLLPKSMTTTTTTTPALTQWTRPTTPDIPSISRARITHHHLHHPGITLTLTLETPWTRITPTRSTLSIRRRLTRGSTRWLGVQVWYKMLQIPWSANQIAHDREQFIRIVVQRLHSTSSIT